MLYSLILLYMSFVCHSYVIHMYSYDTRMSFVCDSYVLVCHPYATRIYSYVLVCHPCVTRMSSVCTRMSSVCTRLWFYYEPDSSITQYLLTSLL